MISSGMERTVQRLFESFDNEFNELGEIAASVEAITKQEENERIKLQNQLLVESRADDEHLSRLEAENILLEKDLEEINQRLEDLRKVRAVKFNKKKTEFQKSENKIALAQSQLGKRKLMNEGIDAFLDKYGIKLAFVGEKRELVSILFSQIYPFEDKQCILYFSELSTKFDTFHVERAEPNFPEFEQLAEQSNKSQDLLALILQSRKYWLRNI